MNDAIFIYVLEASLLRLESRKYPFTGKTNNEIIKFKHVTNRMFKNYDKGS